MNEITKRCAWCGNDPLYIAYHDSEWGKAVFDDKELFAILCLESMQSGLSFITILKKRNNYYHAFADFDPAIIANFDDKKVDELMQNTGIIRHRGKICAIIDNARAYLTITKAQSFADYLWAMSPNGLAKIPQDNRCKSLSDVPSFTEYSLKMAKQLKKDGFKFVGATTCYAFMQACGMVNDHLLDCQFR